MGTTLASVAALAPLVVQLVQQMLSLHIYCFAFHQQCCLLIRLRFSLDFILFSFSTSSPFVPFLCAKSACNGQRQSFIFRFIGFERPSRVPARAATSEQKRETIYCAATHIPSYPSIRSNILQA